MTTETILLVAVGAAVVGGAVYFVTRPKVAPVPTGTQVRVQEAPTGSQATWGAILSGVGAALSGSSMRA